VVGGPPAEQQEAGEGEGVGVDHPLQARRVEAQIATYGRQRDVHDRHVQDDQELAQAGQREHGPRGGRGPLLSCGLGPRIVNGHEDSLGDPPR
jgi:hypothetical protein